MFCDSDVLVTHQSCMDGSACAVLFIAAGGKQENIIFSNPGHAMVDDHAKKLFSEHSGRIFFADISVSEQTAEMLSQRSDIWLFDHHKTAVPLKRFPWCIVDEANSRCGAMVFFDHILVNSQVDLSYYSHLIDLVDDRDRWINSHVDSGQLNYLHNTIGQPAFIRRFLKNPSPIFTSEEQYLLDVEREKRELYIERCRNDVVIRKVDGFKIGYVLCEPKYTSDVGNILCNDLGLDAVLLLSATSISMRAPEGSPLDVSAIAKKYKGGGHRCASGCSIASVFGATWLDLLIDKFKLT